MGDSYTLSYFLEYLNTDKEYVREKYNEDEQWRYWVENIVQRILKGMHTFTFSVLNVEENEFMEFVDIIDGNGFRVHRQPASSFTTLINITPVTVPVTIWEKDYFWE